MIKIILRLLAFVLAVIMTLSFSGCKKDNEMISSDTSADSAPTVTPKPELTDAEKLLDGDTNTFWSAPLGTSSIEFTLPQITEFNAIAFEEHKDYITDYIVEIKENGEYKQVYRQDEMGSRIGIIDETVKAKDIRLTVTSKQELGGVSEITFSLQEGFEAEGFRNVGYFTVSRLESMRKIKFNELMGLTDIILFDFGSWDKNGDFLWGSMGEKYNEAFLKEVLAEIDTALGGKKINIWFSLQNYNKQTTEHTGQLFATEKARKRLADFSLNLCRKYNFCGVDIDYEYPWNSKDYTEVAWKNYSLFLGQLSDTLHAEGYKISCAFYPKRTEIDSDVIPKIDYVNVMSYDMMDSVGRHSGYAVCQKSLDYFKELGFSAEQLILGMPYYTKTTSGEAGPGYNWVINRWRNAIKPWINFSYNNTYTYYFNGPYIIRDKVFFAMKNEMGGVFNWCMGCDVGPDDPRSLAGTTASTIERFSK